MILGIVFGVIAVFAIGGVLYRKVVLPRRQQIIDEENRKQEKMNHETYKNDDTIGNFE